MVLTCIVLHSMFEGAYVRFDSGCVEELSESGVGIGMLLEIPLHSDPIMMTMIRRITKQRISFI